MKLNLREGWAGAGVGHGQGWRGSTASQVKLDTPCAAASAPTHWARCVSHSISCRLAPVLQQQGVPELVGGEGQPLEQLPLAQCVQQVVSIAAGRAGGLGGQGKAGWDRIGGMGGCLGGGGMAQAALPGCRRRATLPGCRHCNRWRGAPAHPPCPPTALRAPDRGGHVALAGAEDDGGCVGMHHGSPQPLQLSNQLQQQLLGQPLHQLQQAGG